MKIKGIDFAMYNVSDLKKGIEFYQKTLGLELTASGEGWTEFMVGNLALVLGSWGFDPEKGGGSNGVAFAVDDVPAAIADLRKKGVKVDGDPWKTPVCDGATFFDPDGNKLSLHHRKDGTWG